MPSNRHLLSDGLSYIVSFKGGHVVCVADLNGPKMVQWAGTVQVRWCDQCAATVWYGLGYFRLSGFTHCLSKEWNGWAWHGFCPSLHRPSLD